MSSNEAEHTLRPRRHTEDPMFRFFVKLFKRMNKDRDLKKLEAVGGVIEVAKALGVDVDYGIDTIPQGQERLSLEDRKDVFGINRVEDVKRRTSFPWTTALFKQQALTPFIVAATISCLLGLSFKEERESLGWTAGAGIWIIVLIIVLTSVASDYQLFQNRGRMNRKKDVFDVTVVRDGKEQLIKNLDLLVGDVLVLTKDVTVAADGLLFVDNDLFINEEIVTGDSRPIKKKLVEDPFCRSGTQVTNGSGKILVTGVGEDSEFGQTMKTVTESTDYVDEWMHFKRRDLFLFSMAALCLGITTFIVLLIHWMVDRKGFPINKISEKGPVHFLILAIIIVVVELPDWLLFLDLFTFIITAWKFERDNIIVLTPFVFDWMSNVSTVCFDKTGTLTENRMTVEKGWFQGSYFDKIPNLNKLHPSTLELITKNACLNSEAFLNSEEDGTIKYIGNQTECALLVMTKKFGVDYVEVRICNRPRIIKNYGFNSDKKMSSVIVRYDNLLRLYNKGAAEMVFNKCTQYIDPSGSRNPISEDKRIEMETTIEAMASQGLRTLALTYVDLDCNEFNFSENEEPLDESEGSKRGFAEPPEEDLVLLAIVGIKDPIRNGVFEVVEQFKKVGIIVRMITGDSLDTAKQVATECGILTDGLAMEGAEFRQKVEVDVEGLMKDLPELQVLARSTPSDKQKLVELLKSIDEKVAVSGDGTNDARALKTSKIGIAMGTNSTEVAREAADVVILNDDISSVLKFYLCSRCSLLSFWNYLQFRLNMTFVIWNIIPLSCVFIGEIPSDARQFLWTNLVVDTLVALAFATESPPAKVPDDGSYHVTRSLSSGISYWTHILLQDMCQTYFLFGLYVVLDCFERYKLPEKDEFYYHYCSEDLRMDTRYRDLPVGPLCDQYLKCTHSTKSCTLFEEQRLDDLGLEHDFRDHIIDEYETAHDVAQRRIKSLIFNIFVFMQLFNSLNCRKVLDDYNIFKGLLYSPISCVVRIASVALQLIIMLTPVRNLFNVTELNAWEWLCSMVASVGVILVSTSMTYTIKYLIRRKIMDRIIDRLKDRLKEGRDRLYLRDMDRLMDRRRR